ncbi:uncharacterized protein LOC127874584 [Dreissena polymorpha]|uniref:Uncharacterized protein n=1 Tax=Dreissena polymorpha TaxID=45954 RepID=A0A9D4L2J0_DREPO|nr:uncharacterized protein LOC127874584 [Dreissena polymorpha]KAH3850732.1 hypothetical protein DPMN_093205 [Dreissena polymorpha]
MLTRKAVKHCVTEFEQMDKCGQLTKLRDSSSSSTLKEAREKTKDVMNYDRESPEGLKITDVHGMSESFDDVLAEVVKEMAEFVKFEKELKALAEKGNAAYTQWVSKLRNETAKLKDDKARKFLQSFRTHLQT